MNSRVIRAMRVRGLMRVDEDYEIYVNYQGHKSYKGYEGYKNYGACQECEGHKDYEDLLAPDTLDQYCFCS